MLKLKLSIACFPTPVAYRGERQDMRTRRVSSD